MISATNHATHAKRVEVSTIAWNGFVKCPPPASAHTEEVKKNKNKNKQHKQLNNSHVNWRALYLSCILRHCVEVTSDCHPFPFLAAFRRLLKVYSLIILVTRAMCSRHAIRLGARRRRSPKSSYAQMQRASDKKIKYISSKGKMLWTRENAPSLWAMAGEREKERQQQ